MARLAIRLGLAVVVGMMAIVAWAFAEARRDPVVRRATVVLPGLARPVTIAVIGDIHIGSPATTPARLTRIVEQINALHPDLVAIAGDFIAGHEPGSATRLAPALTAPLARLRARFGTVAVLGNHDQWTGPGTVTRALTAAKVRVLENEVARIGPLAIAGVGDNFSGHADLPRTTRAARATGRPWLILTHSPDLMPALPPDARLLLAGHTHCGQVVLPWWGPLTFHSPRLGRPLYDPRFRCGLIRSGDHVAIVTAGLGASLPLRLGAPPDLWLVTLRGR